MYSFLFKAAPFLPIYFVLSEYKMDQLNYNSLQKH